MVLIVIKAEGGKNMQYRENVRIQRYINNAGKTFGLVDLQHMADPQSVVVSLCGERLYPEKFNIFGKLLLIIKIKNLFIFN